MSEARKIPRLVQAAMTQSAANAGQAVMLVLLAPKDCTDTKDFLPKLKTVQDAFGRNSLAVIRAVGSNDRRKPPHTPADVGAALDYFAYDNVPGDQGGNQRGHFPSGAIYMRGEKVYDLPSDMQLATIPPQDLAKAICKATGLGYDYSQVLPRRGDPMRRE